MLELNAPELNAIVCNRIELTPGLIVLRVKTEGWELPDFIAGQFVVLALPGSAKRCMLSDKEELAPDADKLIKRAYSVSSSSVEKEYIEFYISLVRSGELTPRLFELRESDKLWMSKKFVGMFTLAEVASEKNIALVATGTGIAPYMSMLRTELELGTKRRFAVIHGAQHSWDLGYRSELETMERVYDNFSYTPIISSPEEENEGWSGATGFIQDLWFKDNLKDVLGFAARPEDTDIFLCGNPLMVQEMLRRLPSDGFIEHTKATPGSIHTEKFW
jgi:ferredoxin--NADP+ reductase